MVTKAIAQTVDDVAVLRALVETIVAHYKDVRLVHVQSELVAKWLGLETTTTTPATNSLLEVSARPLARHLPGVDVDGRDQHVDGHVDEEQRRRGSLLGAAARRPLAHSPSPILLSHCQSVRLLAQVTADQSAACTSSR